MIFVASFSGITGCATNMATGSVTPGTDLGRYKSFYVITQPTDKHNVALLIHDRLGKMGYTVKAGPELAGNNYGTDATVRFLDKWMWDMTLYMLELTVTLRNPANDFPFAKGYSMHTSLTRKSPEEMVDEVLTNIFQAPKQ